jgi:hypothetical protein
MEKANLFFADVMRRHDLNNDQIQTLQSWFFPSLEENENMKVLESTKDMVLAYNKWLSEQPRPQEHQEPVGKMTDEELERLASMF